MEPGRDGVGDYTRRLALEITKNRHQTAILAINDQFVSDSINEVETLENVQIPIFRISSKLAFKNHIEVNNWINLFAPDWTSFQYVPFSFNAKGLPFGLANYLSKLNLGRNLHIMFHELWIGMEEDSTVKYKIWGRIQKLLIKNLIKKLRPKLIDTQTKLYQVQLSKLGYKSNYLPLFSNIPFAGSRDSNIEIERPDKITLVNFGTVHPGAPIVSFSKEAALYKQKIGKEIELLLIGRSGGELEHWMTVWKSAGLKAVALGEQSAYDISQSFNSATFGISSTALPLIEKSGSVAAMHEHKLPVICVSKPWHPKGIKELPIPDGVIEYKTGNFYSCITKHIKVKHYEAKDISLLLLKELSNCH